MLAQSIKERMAGGMSLQEALEVRHAGKYDFTGRADGAKKLALDTPACSKSCPGMRAVGASSRRRGRCEIGWRRTCWQRRGCRGARACGIGGRGSVAVAITDDGGNGCEATATTTTSVDDAES